MPRVDLVNPATVDRRRQGVARANQQSFWRHAEHVPRRRELTGRIEKHVGRVRRAWRWNDRRQARRAASRVAVADRNNCSYCLAAHTVLGKNAGASVEEMADAQTGRSTDPRTAAALAFALKLVEARGQVTDADIAAVRAAGFDDGQIVEIIAHVALNLFTNYLNIALGVPVDFPAVKFRRAA